MYTALKMTADMTTDEYTAKFKILANRTGFNDAALEKMHIPTGSLTQSF